MRLTRNRKMLSLSMAKAIASITLFTLCAAAVALSLFSLELKTEARAVFTPTAPSFISNNALLPSAETAITQHPRPEQQPRTETQQPIAEPQQPGAETGLDRTNTCLLLLAFPAVAQQKAGALKLKPYTFENAKGEKVDAEFGTLLVPEKRSNPESNLIELAFVRFKSTAKNPGPPIVYLAGGPGGSGIGTATGSRFPLFMALREIGDVIAFDQRGTGYAKPNLGCYERLALPLDVAPTRAAASEELRKNARGCIEYWRDIQRVDLTGYNTNESADDLEDLRRALGAKQISLWSISYGTHLALTTIRRHPQSIHDPLFLSAPKIKDGMLEFLKGQPVTVTKISGPPMKFAPLQAK